MDDATSSSDRKLQRSFRDGIIEDMLWLLRYGSMYSQGVAASIVACCRDQEELAWLTAAATVPLTALLLSAGTYAQEWALLVSWGRGGNSNDLAQVRIPTFQKAHDKHLHKQIET
jgi:hypothetical protein